MAKSMMMATAQRATSMTTMTMVTVQRDTTTTTMATDVDNDDDDNNDASSTGCDECDNCNHDDGKDACASATATTQPVVRRRRIKRQGGAKRCDVTTSWHEQRGGVEDRHVRQLRDKR